MNIPAWQSPGRVVAAPSSSSINMNCRPLYHDIDHKNPFSTAIGCQSAFLLICFFLINHNKRNLMSYYPLSETKKYILPQKK